MVERIRGAEVVIDGDNRGAIKSIDEIQKQVKGLNRIIKATIAAFATREVAQLFSTMVNGARDAIDVMSKMSRQTDGTVLGVQALRRAADLSGVSLETMTQSAKQLNVSIGEMTTRGVGPAVDALKRLGLTTEELNQLDIDEKFGLIADRMKALNLTAAEQQALLQQLRIEHATVQNLLESGSALFRQARADVIGFGQAVSDVDAAKIEASNDAWTSFGEVLSGIANQMAVSLSPVMKAIAGDFDNLAKGSVDFSSSFDRAIDSVVGAIGQVLDVIAIWKHRWNSLLETISSGWSSIVNGLDSVRRGIEDTIELLPGMTGYFDELKKNAQEEAEGVKNAFKRAAEESAESWREALGGMLPSENLKAWLEESRMISEAAAEAAVEANKKHREASRQTTNFLSDEEKKRLATARDTQLKALEQMRTNLMSEEEYQWASYQKQLEQLIAFREQKLITQQEYNELEGKLHQQNAEKMLQIQANAFTKSQQLYTGLARGIDGLLSNITTAIGQEGSKQFGITKAIALAQAIVKGYESIVSSYAAGSAIGGPPVGAAYAAIAAGATAAQIASLRSTSENSTSSSGGSGSSGGSAAAAPQAPSQTLTVRGLSPSSLVTGEFMESFATQLLEFQADGGKVIFD